MTPVYDLSALEDTRAPSSGVPAGLVWRLGARRDGNPPSIKELVTSMILLSPDRNPTMERSVIAGPTGRNASRGRRVA